MNDDIRPTHGLTRRELLKRIGALGTGAILTGPLAGCAELWERQPAIAVEAWHKGVCRFCGTGCGVMVGTREGRVVDVQGDEYAHNKGRLCIKGLLNRDILYVKDRALQPMVRANGQLRQATWDEALEAAAEGFRQRIDQYGADSVGFYGSGQLYTQESYAANKLFKAGLGTNNVDGNPRLCMASAAAGYISTFGADEPMGCYEDIDHAECFFVTGSNTAECHPIIWERVRDRQRAYPDETFIIVVDPRRTRTAARAHLHLQIRPGTDVALYNAMLHEFVENGFVDEEMTGRYLTFKRADGGAEATFEDFARHVAAYPPERAAEVCGVGAQEIREAAFRFASAGATMSLWTMGLNQQSQGTACNRLVNAMHLVTGHIGRPGATPFSLTGQPNAGGGVRDTGALAHALPGGRLVVNPEDRAEMEELWDVEPGRISPEPGLHAVAMFDAMLSGRIRAALVMCTNPAQSLPNVSRYRRAMENAFLVVADAIYPTETTQYADVVLPAAMWAEKGPGVFSQSERRYHVVPKIVDPPGQARADLDILVEFADRIGYGDVLPNRTYETIWDEWRQISAHSKYDFSGITMARLQEERGIKWPCPTTDHPGTCIRYVPELDPLAKGDGRFDFYGRPDGRAVVWLHDQDDPRDPRTEAAPLTLTTGRVYEHWHTKTITGGVEELDEIPTDFLQIHPRDARRRGIREGDRVVVENARGEASFVARVTDDVAPGVVFATFHSPSHLVNRVVTDVVDPISKEPEYKISAVEVRPAGEERPDA